MLETAKLIELLQVQITSQQQQMEAQAAAHKEQMSALLQKLSLSESFGIPPVSSTLPLVPVFQPFDSTSELWPGYYDRCLTFAGAHSVNDNRKAQIFLTYQSTDVYHLLGNLAKQQNPPKQIIDLTMDELVTFMKTQYDPKRFVVHERFKFWSDMRGKPGETLQELAARIRQDAVTCDFASIKDPQDEALRSRFTCSVNNEAVLNAHFKVKDDELDFTRGIEIAIETEDAAKVAKDTVHRFKLTTEKSACYRCGDETHQAPQCRFKDSECIFCGIKGHIATVYRKRQSVNAKNSKTSVNLIHEVKAVNEQSLSKLEVPLEIQGNAEWSWILQRMESSYQGRHGRIWQVQNLRNLIYSKNQQVSTVYQSSVHSPWGIPIPVSINL